MNSLLLISTLFIEIYCRIVQSDAADTVTPILRYVDDLRIKFLVKGLHQVGGFQKSKTMCFPYVGLVSKRDRPSV